MKGQDSILSPEPTNYNVLGPKESNLATSYDNDFTTAIRNVFKDIKEYMNNCLYKENENTKT